jgi:hypothetical protein
LALLLFDDDLEESEDFDVEEPSELEVLAGAELVVAPPSDEDDDDDDSFEPDSLAPESFDEPLGPLAEDVDDRESLMYQPLPLKTMPTGWITLRSVPPHCSQVVSGASVKLWRFSMTSLQAVQV